MKKSAPRRGAACQGCRAESHLGFSSRCAGASFHGVGRRNPARTRKPGRLPHDGESGFALLLVFLMAAVMGITLYAELPRVAIQSQRAKEQLLVERGEQFKRAIQLFMRANKGTRFPADMDDLDRGYNNLRFLRHRYKDPMTGKDEWRIIHMQGGVLTDSLLNKPKNGDKPEASTLGQNISAQLGLGEMANAGQGPPSAMNRRRPSEGGTGGGVGPDGQPIQPTDQGYGMQPGAAPGATPQQPGIPGIPGGPGSPFGAAPGSAGIPGMPGQFPGQFPGQPPGMPGQFGMPGSSPGGTAAGNTGDSGSTVGGYGSTVGGGTVSAAPGLSVGMNPANTGNAANGMMPGFPGGEQSGDEYAPADASDSPAKRLFGTRARAGHSGRRRHGGRGEQTGLRRADGLQRPHQLQRVGVRVRPHQRPPAPGSAQHAGRQSDGYAIE